MLLVVGRGGEGGGEFAIKVLTGSSIIRCFGKTKISQFELNQLEFRFYDFLTNQTRMLAHNL